MQTSRSVRLLSPACRLAALLLAVCAVAHSSTSTPAAREIFVSPSGNDTNSGTLARPIRTLAHARDFVRTINRAMKQDIVVWLRGGTYPLVEPLEFTPADSGNNGFTVTYRAWKKEVPVISGGIPVTGWTLDHGQVYKARLDRVVKLRSLFVNGVRASMTGAEFKGQGPRGEFKIAGTEPWAETPGSTLDGVAFSDGEVPVMKNPSDVELHQRRVFSFIVLGIREIRNESGRNILFLQQPYGAIAATMAWNCNLDPNGNFTIRNAFEFLNQPGQFYFDRAKQTLYYYSDGEDMSKATVIAPLSEGLLRIAGASTDNRVHDLRFEGLTFAYDHWLLKKVGDSRGATGVQSLGLYTRFRADGNHHRDHYDMLDLPQSSVELQNCDRVRFERNHFKHLSSGCGVGMVNDVVNTVVEGNVFDDISGNAVNVGHPQHYIIGGGPLFPTGVAGVCSNDMIKNNLVRRVCLDFKQEEGISGFFTQGLEISHNDVKGVPYGGIALGWWWGDAGIPPSTVSRDNVIAYNRIVDTQRELPDDGGALYVLGKQPNGQIKNNYIRSVTRGIYPDDGTAYWTVKNNVVETRGNLWLHIWSNRIHDIKIDNNYTNTDAILNNGTNCPVTGMHLEKNAPPWSPEAQAIIDGSGLEPEYRDIISTRTSGLIGIQFGAAGRARMVAGAAVTGGRGDEWNMLAGDGASHPPLVNIDLHDTGGADSGITLGLDKVNYDNTAADPGGLPLFTGSLFIDGATPATLTLGGFHPGQVVDLYLYASVVNPGTNGKRGAAFTFNGVTRSVTGSNPNTRYEPGSNYVEFSGLTADPSGKITGTWAVNPGSQFSSLNGLQIWLAPKSAQTGAPGAGNAPK